MICLALLVWFINSPDLTTMNNPTTFCVVLASYITAGLFGVAFVQTALTESLQQHSGTQSYVRVIR